MITGDGNLLFESVSQSIPTISIDRGMNKNSDLFALDLAWCVDSNIINIMCLLRDILYNNITLEHRHLNLINFNKVDRSGSLSKSIVDIIAKD